MNSTVQMYSFSRLHGAYIHQNNHKLAARKCAEHKLNICMKGPNSSYITHTCMIYTYYVLVHALLAITNHINFDINVSFITCGYTYVQLPFTCDWKPHVIRIGAPGRLGVGMNSKILFISVVALLSIDSDVCTPVRATCSSVDDSIHQYFLCTIWDAVRYFKCMSFSIGKLKFLYECDRN